MCASLSRMPNPDHRDATQAVYDHSAKQYVGHIGTTISDRFESLLDQSMLTHFGQLVRAEDPEQNFGVLDIGCGPGRATAFLAAAGLNISGVDLSKAMVDAATAAHQHISFELGELAALPVPDQSLSGAVLWYSIIHTPLADLGAAWDELLRTVRAGGPALIAFQSGKDETLVRRDAHGSSIDLTSYRHGVASVLASLAAKGFRTEVNMTRQPTFDHEDHAQTFLIMRTPRQGS